MNTVITKLANGNVWVTNAPGEFAFPGDMQVLKTTTACVIRDKAGSRQHIFEANDVLKVVRQDATEIVIGGDNDVLFSELINFFFFRLTNGGGGGGDKFFEFTQSIPSATWVINHNLDKKPSVMVVDTGNNVVEGCEIYIDNNNLEIQFGAPFSGKAYLN